MIGAVWARFIRTTSTFRGCAREEFYSNIVVVLMSRNVLYQSGTLDLRRLVTKLVAF